MSSILIVGAGGHAKVVLATLLAAGEIVEGLLDDRTETWGSKVLNYPVLGGLSILKQTSSRAIIAIGHNRVRQILNERYPSVNWTCVVHPSAFIHPSVTLGAGSVVFAGAVIQPDTHIGKHVIVNTAATVDHDCVLEDYVHIAPGAHLAGQVHLESGAFLGIGGAAAPGTRVGAWATIGAGGVVIHAIPPNSVAIGIPARPRRAEDKK